MNPRSLALRGASLPLAALLVLTFARAAIAGDDPAKPPMMPGSDAPKPPAVPAPPGGDERRGRFFDMYDANADGKVTKDEYTGDAALFDLLDTNHDGEITTAELGAPANYVPGMSDRPK